MTDNQKFIADLIVEFTESGKLSNADLVKLIKLINDYLNLRPLLEFGKENGITYPGLLKSKRFKVVEVLNKKWVIDND
jgi:hypothetical protein